MKQSKSQKDNPKSVFKIVKSAGDIIFEGRPFALIKTKKNKEYVKTLVTKCGVIEDDIQKILVETFEAGAIFRTIAGKNHEGSATAAALLDGYTKAIQTLINSQQAIQADQTFLGNLKDEIQRDIRALKKRRAEWGFLYVIHAEQEPKNLTAMLVNQTFCLCNYIEKCHAKAGLKYTGVAAYEFIAELFRAIYHDPFFKPERFTKDTIKLYYDNATNHYKDLKKSHPRKSLETF